jgi:carbon starvation protein
MKRERYAWVTALPCLWLLACTLTAGWQKMFHDNPAIGFLAHARKFSDAIAVGEILAPAKSLQQMNRIVFNDIVDASLCGLFMTVVLAMVIAGAFAIRRALADPKPSARETLEGTYA